LAITPFSDYLKPAQIIHDLKAKDKVRAIEELLDVLAKEKLIGNKKVILTRLIDRENLVSTALGEGVAVPHARVDTGGEMAVAVGRSEKGLDFEAPDKKKVHLIILVVWNPSLPGCSTTCLPGWPISCGGRIFRKRAFEAKDKADLAAVLSEIELRLPHEDKIVSRAGLLKKLQEIEIKRLKSPKPRPRPSRPRRRSSARNWTRPS